jgi:hypothetical protein
MSASIPSNAYALIIGAMKCGTSSLYSYLVGHPEICPVINKEPEYFSENQSHGVEVERYEDLWPAFDPSVHRFALEASTGYTKYPAEPNVAANIHAYGIRPKFIYIMRNPFDRITSHYNFMGQEDSGFEGIKDSHLLHTSNYFLQLEQYRKLFPVEDFLLLDFDDLKKDPGEILTRIYAFLGLPATWYPDSYEKKNVTELESRAERRIRTGKARGVLRFIPRPVKNVCKRLIRKSNPPSKYVLSEEERAFIHSELAEGMEGLKGIYGFDTGRWGF